MWVTYLPTGLFSSETASLMGQLFATPFPRPAILRDIKTMISIVAILYNMAIIRYYLIFLYFRSLFYIIMSNFYSPL